MSDDQRPSNPESIRLDSGDRIFLEARKLKARVRDQYLNDPAVKRCRSGTRKQSRLHGMKADFYAEPVMNGLHFNREPIHTLETT